MTMLAMLDYQRVVGELWTCQIHVKSGTMNQSRTIHPVKKQNWLLCISNYSKLETDLHLAHFRSSRSSCFQQSKKKKQRPIPRWSPAKSHGSRFLSTPPSNAQGARAEIWWLQWRSGCQLCSPKRSTVTVGIRWVYGEFYARAVGFWAVSIRKHKLSIFPIFWCTKLSMQDWPVTSFGLRENKNIYCLPACFQSQLSLHVTSQSPFFTRSHPFEIVQRGFKF